MKPALRHFPTGGWGIHWVGDADRGFGQDQPGGWIYNILPFIEQKAKHDMPKDGKPNEHTDPQLQGARQMLLEPLSIIYSPSRRSGKFYNKEEPVRFANNSALNPPGDRGYVGRSDYAANAGDYPIGGGQGGPGGLLKPNSYYDWYVVSKTGILNSKNNADGTLELTGIAFQRSEIGIKHISDGTSKTYFAGEKYLDSTSYETGTDTGDNETWCTGHNNDNFRTTGWNPDNPTEYLPRPDGPMEIGGIFGSAHPVTWNVSYCDGHVEAISYDIDPLVHRNKSNRQDGNAD